MEEALQISRSTEPEILGEAIKLNKLTKIIKGNIILDNISLSLNKGQIYGFIGYNGSGKSMLFKSICGFIIPTKGEITILNKKLGIEMDFPESVGAIIEHPGFLPDLSGFGNLKFLAEIQNIISDEDIKDAMLKVGLDPGNNKRVKTYSLGMKQRLGIAQAIMENPEILILDEPMNGLDKEGVKKIRTLLLTLKEEGKTILLSSHITEDIEILCNHVWEMDKGTISQLR